jgi:hypothetical protein
VLTEIRLTGGKTNLGKCRAEAFSGYHLLYEGERLKGAKAQRPLEFQTQNFIQLLQR